MLQRIKWFQVALIGGVLIILVGAGGYIGLIKPMQERLAAANSTYDTQSATLAQAQHDEPLAVKDKAKAKVEVAQAQSDWAQYDRALMPNINLSNRFTATHQLWNEQLNVLGPKVLKFLYADRSVKVVSEQVTIPQPSGDPNDVVKKLFVYPLGTITVSGTMEQVLRNAERWNHFDRLALVDGLTLAGNSPTLTGTYNVTLYEIPHFDQVGPVIPTAGPVTSPGGGGGFGGPGGGFGPPSGGPFGPGGPFGGPGSVPPGYPPQGPPRGYGGPQMGR